MIPTKRPLSGYFCTVLTATLGLGGACALAQEDNSDLDSSALSISGDDDLSQIFNLKNYTARDITFYWENDGTVPNFVDDTDRYYSNGAGIEMSFDPNLSQSLRSRLAISDDPAQQRFGVGIGIKQRIYTPADIDLQDPPPRDHPYAGYLALALSFQRADNSTHEHFGLDLGVVGHASAGETIQKWIHNTFPDEIDPKGWETQLANEPTINFAYTRTWKSDITMIGGDDGLELEMLPSVGFDAGTVRIGARSSMTLRLGKHLPTDFGPANLLGHKDHTVAISDSARTIDGSASNWSIYLYTTLGVDAIARDIFIDGNAFASSRSAQRESLVATISVGLVGRYKALYLGWTQHFQTQRFERQLDDEHTWGSIVFGCSFDW